MTQALFAHMNNKKNNNNVFGPPEWQYFRKSWKECGK
jgi:hypothetical protein